MTWQCHQIIDLPYQTKNCVRWPTSTIMFPISTRNGFIKCITIAIYFQQFFQKHLLGIFQIVFSDSWTFFIWVKNYQCSTRLYEIVPSCLFIKSKMRFLIETQDFEISSLIRRKKRIEETDRRTDRQTNREREVHKCYN